MARSRYIVAILVSSLQHYIKNMLEIFVIQHTSIWPSLILIASLDILRTKHFFFFQIKKFINYTSRAKLLQKLVL